MTGTVSMRPQERLSEDISLIVGKQEVEGKVCTPSWYTLSTLGYLLDGDGVVGIRVCGGVGKFLHLFLLLGRLPGSDGRGRCGGEGVAPVVELKALLPILLVLPLQYGANHMKWQHNGTRA